MSWNRKVFRLAVCLLIAAALCVMAIQYYSSIVAPVYVTLPSSQKLAYSLEELQYLENKAIDRNNPNAAFLLGRYYSRPGGHDSNPVVAVYWFRVAESLGHAQARRHWQAIEDWQSKINNNVIDDEIVQP